MHGDSGQVHIDMKITAFARFSAQFEKSFKDNPRVIRSVLANIFSMRIIGNKTHGDLAEIALTEYISQFVGGNSDVCISILGGWGPDPWGQSSCSEPGS